ncbi:MAG TPA: hypothetical protein VKR28_00955 [Candidatus Binatus sp.]|nr:hypothetical protein [Candidatus Binatus sp.]
MWIAIRGNNGGAELECVSRTQRMFHDNALGVNAGGGGVGDFNPPRSDFVHFPARPVPAS